MILINSKISVNTSGLAREDQILTLTGASWKDYEQLDTEDYKHYLISYLNHEITIMSPGRNHERIAETIGILIEAYCEKYNIPCFPFGSTRLIKEGVEGKEPDTAYAFIVDKDNPDLAVEVNFTSGSIKDLTKYKHLKIREVWVWQNREIKFYALKGDRYEKIEQSINFEGIKSAVLIGYINRGFNDSIIAIKKDFLKEFK